MILRSVAGAHEAPPRPQIEATELGMNESTQACDDFDQSRGQVNRLRLVLDTNVVVDWLVFDHPFMKAFRDGVRRGDVVVLTNALAIDELARVLRYPMLKLDRQRQQRTLQAYLDQTSPADMPEGFGEEALLLPAAFPRCRDHDDDRFLALAFHARASALVSRDKALLKLRKRVGKFGLTILDVPQMMSLIGA